MTVIEVKENRKQYLPLLLLADEQEDMIGRYIGRGRMFILEEDGQAVAEILITDEGDGIAEIKSLAVTPEHQGEGLGRALIEYAADLCRGEFSVLQVGTGDSPLTLPFYEHCGFTRHHVLKNFFTDNYSHPIFEGGEQLRDMVFLRKDL